LSITQSLGKRAFPDSLLGKFRLALWQQLPVRLLNMSERIYCVFLPKLLWGKELKGIVIIIVNKMKTWGKVKIISIP